MTEDKEVERFFEQDNPEQANEMTRAAYYEKKLQRRVRVAIFGFIIITFLPRLFGQQVDFDVILNSTLFLVAIMMLLFYTFYVIVRFNKRTDYTVQKNRKAVKRHADYMDLTAFIISVFMVFVLINTFFVSLTSVAMDNSTSMQPTLEPGDDLLVYHFNIEYERFDIVVAKVGEDIYYVKRLIGFPGDEIVFDNQELFILPYGETEWIQYDEPYLSLGAVTCAGRCEFSVGDDEVFLLGDNRSNSSDSRDSITFRVDDLYGKVIFRVRPVSTFGRVE